VAQHSRVALFVAIAVALVAAGLLLGSGAHPAAPSSRSPASRRPSSPALAVADRAAASASARRFLDAFLSNEMGDRSRRIRQQLTANATPAFASRLLAESPLVAATSPSRAARLGHLTIVLLAHDPPLASVSGVAHRPSGPEQLSFVFVGRRGRWLASAPGE
jgi:hypothetical protein